MAILLSFMLAPVVAWLERLRVPRIPAGVGARMIVLSYMNQDSITHAKYLVRRLRRRAGTTRVMLGFWSMTSDGLVQRKVLDETRADFMTISLRDALEQITSAATTEKGEK